MNTAEEIRREDCDTYQEYVHLRNRAKSRREQLSRFSFLLAKIRKYEGEGMADEDIVKQLANHCEYKLVSDKNIKRDD